EVFSAAQQRWLEVSSVSNFETYQANRLKVRFKNEQGKMQLAHTLNGSALALPRIVASILENNQTEKGIRIPEVLVPYTGFEWIDKSVKQRSFFIYLLRNMGVSTSKLTANTDICVTNTNRILPEADEFMPNIDASALTSNRNLSK